MFYEDGIIEEIRAANDIVDVIGQSVRLEKRGSNYFGNCPFHTEKTPSFSVSPAKQMFYCFGCGAGGNVFSFVQKYDNVSFREALEKLAERARITLPVQGNAQKEKEKQDKRTRLLEANKEAATWYYHRLREEKGSRGLQYLTQRGLDAETIRHFGLGFAPMTRDDLTRHLRAKGFSDTEIVEAGLAVRDEKSGLKDKFWNRVMFPIQDVTGRVIGFGGRVTGEGEPKYLNSPETLIFDKGRNLYGLQYARNARKGRIILCEGYMDVIAMHMAGFTESCASLGTAFTAGQATVLKRYAQEAVLAYDSDEAGTRAALRAIGILRQAGIRVKVLRLAPCKDPDELIRTQGREEMERRVLQAENAFYFETALAERSYSLQDPAEATQFYRQLASMLMETFPDALERETYVQAVCARYHIEPADMKEEMARGFSLTAGRRSSPVQARRESGNRVQLPEQQKSQRMLLTWLSERPGDYDTIRRYVTPADFTDPFCRRVAEYVYDALEHKAFLPAQVIDRFEEEEERTQCAAIFHAQVGTKEKEYATALHDILYDVMKRSYEETARQADPSGSDYLEKTVRGKQRLESFARKRLEL